MGNVITLLTRPRTSEPPLAALCDSDRAYLMVQYRRLQRELKHMLDALENSGLATDALRARAIGSMEALAEVVLQAPDA